MNRRRLIVENHFNGRPVDLVVGIPSRNEADNIDFVVGQVAQGLQRHYPELQTGIVNADNLSEDGTKTVFLNAASGKIPKVYLSTAPGVRGKGNNFFNLFSYLAPYQPRAVVVVDADLRSITPDWTRRLAAPILDGYDFVVPRYSRNEYDGTITNHLCYPLIYGLLGKNIRQPIGGDFAFSGKLMEYWLTRKWYPSIRRYGVDIFMTCRALLADFRVAQAELGVKIHRPSAPKLLRMFTEVVDTLFSTLLESKESWTLTNGRPVQPRVFGRRRKVDPQGLGIDYKDLKRQALQGFAPHKELIAEILPDEIAQKIQYQFEVERLRVSAFLWMRIVYAFLEAYDQTRNRVEKRRVVEALRPLYFARVVCFIRETLELSHEVSEERIVRQAEIFHRNRRIVTNKLSASLSATNGCGQRRSRVHG